MENPISKNRAKLVKNMATKPKKTGTIPNELKIKIEEMVQHVNSQIIKDPDYHYTTRYKGKYLYLDRADFGKPSPICRLEYTGGIDGWEFAIYKYSDNKYDPDEWFFPGSGLVNGTIEGAMLAGLEAYP